MRERTLRTGLPSRSHRARQRRTERDGRALADGDVVTACQQACPAEAIRFGDITDAASGVSQAKANPRNYNLLDDLHTKPRTTYLAKIRHPNRDITPAPPFAEDHGDGEDAH